MTILSDAHQELEVEWVGHSNDSFNCFQCRGQISTTATDFEYDSFIHDDGDEVSGEEKVICPMCKAEYLVKAEATIEVEVSFNITDKSVFLIHTNGADIPQSLAGKMVGDSVDIDDGVYRLNIFEYHVVNGLLAHKFSILTDENQLSMEDILFPSAVLN